MTPAREKFEKDFDATVFRSTPKEVFEFLWEQEKKRIITLYAGTYSFENAVGMCKLCEKATFYFYLNGYNYGYALTYCQGRFNLQRDERIFFSDHKKAYSKKALSNRKTDIKDMRSGEYYEKKKYLIKGEINEGLAELLIYLVGFILFGSVGYGVVSLFGIEKDVDVEVVLLLGFLTLVVVGAFIFVGVGITKSLRSAKKEKKK
ncbi:MAG: hypothetical protein IKA02_02825 [Clostridia bacterium]|nr:hypothetical protein [Clostridia bacterium]